MPKATLLAKPNPASALITPHWCLNGMVLHIDAEMDAEMEWSSTLMAKPNPASALIIKTNQNYTYC